MALDISSVEAAVLNHLGSRYRLKDWSMRDFTKKGDNYVTVVTGVEANVFQCQEKVAFKHRLSTNPSNVRDFGRGINEENDRLNANDAGTKTDNDHSTITNLIFDLNEVTIRDDINIVDIFQSPQNQGVSLSPDINNPETDSSQNTNNQQQEEINSNVVGNNSQLAVSYVAKFLPKRADGPFLSVICNLHRREGEFMCNIAPRLNAVLHSAGMTPLAIPKCYYACYVKGKELLINEDMRAYRFKMADRRRGLTKPKVVLVLKELAKLHASSYILRKRNNNENFETTYSFIRDSIKDREHSTITFFEQIYQGNIAGTVRLLEHAGGLYGSTVRWLQELCPNIVPKLAEQLTCEDDRFKVLCHGDTWNNNFLFNASSVCLVDLQTCRFSSLATDLTYFLHTSVTTDTRRLHTDHFLAQYHSAYEGVLKAAGLKMKFNVDDLKAEVLSRQLWGLSAAMLIVPTIVLDSVDAPVLNTVADEQYESSLQGRWDKNLRRMNTSKEFRERFLGVFDDMIQSGFLPADK